MNDPLTEMRFWQQVRTDAERTIACNTAEADGIRSWIDVAGYSHLIKVIGTPFVEIGHIVIIDTHAIDAGFAAAVQRDFAAQRRAQRLATRQGWYRPGLLAASAVVDPKAIISGLC